jgi:hypothetical protein
VLLLANATVADVACGMIQTKVDAADVIGFSGIAE